jgi:hypothetical protein
MVASLGGHNSCKHQSKRRRALKKHVMYGEIELKNARTYIRPYSTYQKYYLLWRRQKSGRRLRY